MSDFVIGAMLWSVFLGVPVIGIGWSIGHQWKEDALPKNKRRKLEKELATARLDLAHKEEELEAVKLIEAE